MYDDSLRSRLRLAASLLKPAWVRRSHGSGATSSPARDTVIAHWGAPIREARFETAKLVVDVLKYDFRATGQGDVTYVTATTGATPSGHFPEFVLGLDAPHDEVADPLARLSDFARETAVHHGDSVPMAEPLWPGTAMRRFLVILPDEPIFGPRTGGRPPVTFMPAFPMYEAELPAKRELGPEGFLQQLRAAGLGLAEADRPPLTRDIPRR